MSFFELIAQGDAVSRLVALLLVGMSVASWVVILWKVWLLPRARRGVGRSLAAFWQAGSLEDAQNRLVAFDREALVLPLIRATQTEGAGTLAAAGDRAQQLTRVLRDALHDAINKLQYGQVLLATVGSTAPFVGLLGTVWGIYHALTAIASTGQITIDKVAGPVGEALIMTAFGLFAAIPALLAYNAFVRFNRVTNNQFDTFAHDLHDFFATGSRVGELQVNR